MSKADKMFKDLGYNGIQNSFLKKTANGQVMHFSFANGGFIVSVPPNITSVKISAKEIFAVHEKLKELGWLDE